MIVNQAALAAIFQSFSTIFAEAFSGVQPMWPTVAMDVPSTARSTLYKWLGNFPMMREWLGDRVVKDLSAFGYEIVNKDYEATVEVDRNDIDDDQIGLYKPMIQGLAQSAADHPDVLIFALMKAAFSTECYDGQYFYDTDHEVNGASVSNFGGGSGSGWHLLDLSRPIKPFILQRRKHPEFVSMDNPEDEHAFMRRKFRYGVDDRKNCGLGLWQLAYGSKDTLNSTNYAAARAAMMGFTNDEGVPLGIKATHLVVPPTLESAGRKLLKNQQTDAGATNEWFGTAELLVAPWLA